MAAEAANAQALRPARRPADSRFWLAVVAALATGGALGLVPTSTACDAVGAGFFAALGVVAIDAALLGPVFRSRSRRLAAARAGAVAVAGAASAALMYQSLARVFETAFGTPPPAGVVDFKADRRYMGGPGDVVTVMTFRADRATVERIVAARNFRRVDEEVEQWREHRDWQQFCVDAFGRVSEFGGALTESGQTVIPPMTRPVLYEWKPGGPGNESTELLWDAETGLAYAQYGFG